MTEMFAEILVIQLQSKIIDPLKFVFQDDAQCRTVKIMVANVSDYQYKQQLLKCQLLTKAIHLLKMITVRAASTLIIFIKYEFNYDRKSL